MYVNLRKLLSVQKATPGRPAYIHRCYAKSVKPNFSFRFGARSKSGKVKPGDSVGLRRYTVGIQDYSTNRFARSLGCWLIKPVRRHSATGRLSNVRSAMGLYALCQYTKR